jgi:hypothetical protein
MSYDLQIWSVRAFDPSALGSDRWKNPVEAQWLFEGTTWQLSIFRSSKILSEDVPEEIVGMLPGIQYLTELNLEGKATVEAMKLAKSTANNIAKTLHGIVFDAQEDTAITPQGVRRFVPPGKQETFSVLNMSWWFLESPLLSSAGRKTFVEFLDRHLPEALPRRYGTHEPPQFVYADSGKSHFLEFLDGNIEDLAIWYPHRPVVAVNLRLAVPSGGTKRGFRANQLNIEIELDALAQPGWPEAVGNFWRGVSRIARPIYGEVRKLGGRIRRGGTIYLAPKNGTSIPTFGPTKAWWWRGVPSQLGCAVVLGAEYQKLWQSFMQRANVEDGLAFASTEDWTSTRDLAEETVIPSSLLMCSEEAHKYPEAWPFGPPFVEAGPHK